MNKEIFKKDKFALHSGVEVLEMSEGYAKTRMLVTPEHWNAGGTCQGGAIFTLADVAFAAAANSHDRLTVSLTANITFFRAVSEGFLYAEAHETVNHARIPFVEVRVTDEDGLLVAMMTSSGYRRDISLSELP